MREEPGTRLIALRACTSKNVMPRKPGVSNDLVIAPRSNSAGAEGRGRAQAPRGFREAGAAGEPGPSVSSG